MTQRPKPRKIQYSAKFNGAVVGRRVSHVPYTHAIVVQESEDRAHKDAYAPEPEDWLRQYYNEDVQIANSRPGAKHPRWDRSKHSWLSTISARGIEEARKNIEGGFEAYFQRHREDRIKRFEEEKIKGAFEPKVVKWLRQEELAEQTDRYKREHVENPGYWKFVCVVSSESVEGISIAKSFSKLPKTAQHTILAGVCEQMITRKAWNEIAALLVGQLGPDITSTLLKLVRS
ncbi:hypothetical protein BH10PSE10_BH10PSE10_04710 [soil metagenome]